MERAASELSQVIRCHFRMHGARMACLLALIWSVIGAKRVQLWALAEQFGGEALVESRIKRIKRFLRDVPLPITAVAQCIIALLSPSGQWTLVMDRTNWKYGKLERNYLVLAIAHRGNAIPLLFTNLGRAGASDTSERIALMQQFLTLFGKEKIFCLLGDREFIGEDWFQWMQQNGIRPCIRTRNNTQVRHRNGGKVPVKDLLRSLPVGEKRVWEEQLFGVRLRVTGMKLSDGDYLVLLSDLSLPEDSLPLYKIRWSIECLFKNQKSTAFLWETTHLVHAERAEKLASILALASALAVKEGIVQHSLKPIPFRKTVSSPLYSLFLHGLRSLADSLRKNTTYLIGNPLIYNTSPIIVP